MDATSDLGAISNLSASSDLTLLRYSRPPSPNDVVLDSRSKQIDLTTKALSLIQIWSNLKSLNRTGLHQLTNRTGPHSTIDLHLTSPNRRAHLLTPTEQISLNQRQICAATFEEAETHTSPQEQDGNHVQLSAELDSALPTDSPQSLKSPRLLNRLPSGSTSTSPWRNLSNLKGVSTNYLSGTCAWLQPVFQEPGASRLIAVDSSIRSTTRFETLRQTALEVLTRSARSDSPRKVGRKQISGDNGAAAAAAQGGGGGGRERGEGGRLCSRCLNKLKFVPSSEQLIPQEILREQEHSTLLPYQLTANTTEAAQPSTFTVPKPLLFIVPYSFDCHRFMPPFGARLVALGSSLQDLSFDTALEPWVYLSRKHDVVEAFEHFRDFRSIFILCFLSFWVSVG
ncbi:protein FLUORESCENT IN BLUE LIGHT, chloroplastic [Dorcoceras hygrometricum]|uniref:Protein FLUORESCENT IN BLUE LIGHT, chloroplastic n=1 Tax=Dorcoceras hygrometricum TaxID=472368 RepID=A0A2Z7C0Z3_9LAMI|nr:protein FLUORESCENT IN BLUE LIGHT, chloroplastic [Dorcoceras hygrometricum]